MPTWRYLRALEVSGDRDLSIKVDYARYYARTLYDRELHDRLLQEVLEQLTLLRRR